MMLPARTKYLVVGAGLHGLSTAYHLGKELAARGQGSGADIVILEKSHPGAGASGIACGVVRNNYFQPAMSELMAACMDIWESDPEAFTYHGSGYVALGPAAQEPDLVEVAERHERIGDGDSIAGQRVSLVGGDDRGDGAPLARKADEVVTVEALALERDEEVALAKHARVGRNTAEAHVLAEHAAFHRAGGRRDVHHAGSPYRFMRAPCPASFAFPDRRGRDVDVGKRRPHAVALLVVLVALAGDEHDIAGRSTRDRAADRRTAIQLHVEAASARGANARHHCCRDCGGILASRVVVGDDDPVRALLNRDHHNFPEVVASEGSWGDNFGEVVASGVS